VLGNYGTTVDLAHPAGSRDSGDDGVQTLLAEMASGSVAALFIDGVNLVYDLPNGAEFAAALAKVPTVVSFADHADETSKLATFVCPDHHYLEAWGDVAVSHGMVGLRQPTMRPLFDTRSMLESLSLWAGRPQSAREIVQKTWRGQFAWDQAVHDGFASVAQEPVNAGTFRAGSVSAVRNSQKLPEGKLALILYPKVSMMDGRHASNPWLQELPDPISKVVWDNYACLSESTAERLGLKTGDVVRCAISGTDATTSTVELPMLVQPGQHDGVLAIALGYGREDSARFADVGPKWIERKPTLGDNGLVGIAMVHCA
jgi:molybdopterin-containing oxidoreductase family iron-sulfur binding subunit